MKNKILILVLSFFVLTTFAQEIEKPKFIKKNELSITASYAKTLSNRHGGVYNLYDRSTDNIIDSYTIDDTHNNGIGIKIQYNKFLKKYFYVSSSLNFNYFIPTRVPTYYEMLTPKPNGYFSQHYDAGNSIYADGGVGFVLFDKPKYTMRIGFGFGIGNYYRSTISAPVYDVYEENGIKKIAFYGYTSNDINSLLLGGFGESSILFPVYKGKIYLGINYKFAITPNYSKLIQNRFSNIEHNLGLAININFGTLKK